MPYIVKSSLDIGGKIIPWNEQEANKLIKEKEEIIKKQEEIEKQSEIKEEEKISEEIENKNVFKKNKKKDKVGE